MIERIHLRILHGVAEQGSLTRAAEDLCLSQSALSHAIKKLEYQVGTSLWVKDGRKLQLTQAGNYLLKESQRLLPQFDRIDAVLRQFAAGDKGTLRIGMECHPCYKWLLSIVEQFLAQWPGVDVDVKQQFQFGGMAALFSNEIDVLVSPDPLFKPGILFRPVFPYEQVLAVSNLHPLSKKRWITPEDVLEQVLYTYPVERERLDIYKEFLTPAGCTPKRHKEIETTEIMMQLVAANRGVAAMPSWLVNERSEALNIRGVQFGEKGISKYIHLGVREQDTHTPYIESFLELAG